MIDNTGSGSYFLVCLLFFCLFPLFFIHLMTFFVVGLETGQNDAWILDSGLNFAQESDSLTAINQAMIIGQSDVHHWSDDNLLGMKESQGGWLDKERKS